MTKQEPKVELVWINIEAKMTGKYGDWERGRMTDPPEVDNVNEERAARLTKLFKKDFPVGRYVCVLDDHTKTKHWVHESWVRMPAATRRSHPKPIPEKLMRFAEKLKTLAAKAKEEATIKATTKGVSSNAPAHVLAKRAKQKQRDSKKQRKVSPTKKPEPTSPKPKLTVVPNPKGKKTPPVHNHAVVKHPRQPSSKTSRVSA